MNQMIAMEITFDTRIEDLMKRYDQYLNLQKPVEYIKKDLGSRFSYLLHQEMKPKNNLAEQATHEP